MITPTHYMLLSAALFMIGVIGVRIWVQNRVNFGNPINLSVAGVSLVVAIANFTWTIGELRFEGIALGTAAALLIYEHSLVRHDDFSRLDAAFFTMNGVISIVFFLCALTERLAHYAPALYAMRRFHG